MHPIVCASLLLLFLPATLAAQAAPDLEQYDARMAYFEKTGQRDSVLHYAGRKAALARKADQLALWTWIQIETHDYLSDAPQAALHNLNLALAGQWRAPANAPETEALVYLQSYRGYYLSALGRIWDAVEAYEAAAAGYARHPVEDPDFEVTEMIYKPLGNHYTRLGDNEKALAIFQQALAATPADALASRAGLYNNIGIAQWNQDDFSASEQSYRAGLALPGAPADKRLLLLTGLARTQLDQGLPRLAWPTAEAALRLLPGLAAGPEALEYRAYTQRTAGLIRLKNGQWGEAQHLLRQALASALAAFGPFSRDVGKAHLALAGLYQAQGQWTAALDAAHQALRAVLPEFRSDRVENNPAATLFYEENTIYEALGAKAAAAEALYRHSGRVDWLRLAMDCHDLAWQAEWRVRQVFQYRSSKIGLQNIARRREASALQVARWLYEKTGAQEWLKKGFAIAERSRAVLLLENLRDNLIRQRLAGKDARFAQLEAMEKSKAWYERQYLLYREHAQRQQWVSDADALQGKINALRKSLYQSYPHLYGLDSAAPEPGSGRMAAGELLVEYFRSESFLDIFLCNNSGPMYWRRIPYDSMLQGQLQRFLGFFKDANAILADPAGYLELAYALGQQLLPPETASAQRLCLVPDGLLHFVPFEALLRSRPAPGASLRRADYLICRQEIRYAWSWATLQQQEAFAGTAPDFFLGLAPLFPGSERGLAPLPAGAAEWNALPAGSPESWLGAEARAKRFCAEAGRYRLLHLCTHARADQQDSLPPRIELYDEALLLPDIYTLSLHAELVVLSACQTGIGAEQSGEGVMSLARAFAHSGAACILSSLWTVNDRSSTRLFQSFYGSLRNGKPVGAALRQAKLQYLGDNSIGAAWQTPYFWAGMVAVGANRPVDMPWSWHWWWVVFLVVGVSYFVFRGACFGVRGSGCVVRISCFGARVSGLFMKK
ncbi:MAG: CHAT domain-containing protein [Saprospiraceae bacterium]|nr:CHAT domain-containing protein [Saprospiraceae bacterium]